MNEDLRRRLEDLKRNFEYYKDEVEEWLADVPDFSTTFAAESEEYFDDMLEATKKASEYFYSSMKAAEDYFLKEHKLSDK